MNHNVIAGRGVSSFSVVPVSIFGHLDISTSDISFRSDWQRGREALQVPRRLHTAGRYLAAGTVPLLYMLYILYYVGPTYDFRELDADHQSLCQRKWVIDIDVI